MWGEVRDALIVLARLILYGHGAARLHDEVLAVVAEWDPADPSRRLRKLSDAKSQRALQDLEASLQQRLEAPAAITSALKGHLSADVAQLRPDLDRVVEQRRQDAAGKLGKRAEEDADELKAVRRQVADNWRSWEQRLASIDSDLEREPERIRRTFALQTHRVEPAGALYLWPQDQ